MGSDSLDSATTDPSKATARPLTTKHGRLRDLLAERIASGDFARGQFLPSEPALAKQFDISRGTVRQALAELQNDGYVERIPGKGTLVCRGVGGAGSPSMQRRSHQPHQSPARETLRAFAVVLPEIRTGHYPALVHSFDEAAAELHHQILCCTTSNDVRRQGDIILQLIDKNVAGVALSPPTVGSPPVHQIRQLQNHGIPVVLLHRAVDGIAVPVIEMPYERIAGMAATALLEAGHRRVGFYASHRSSSAERYLAGFADAMRKFGEEVHGELVHFGETPLAPTGSPSPKRIAEIKGALDKMLALPSGRRPTAIFDPWDADMEAVYLILTQQGIRVPEEFSLVSFGGASRTGTLSSRITSVTVDEPGFARQAVELLEKMYCGDVAIDDNQRLQVGVNFYAGETLCRS